MRRFGWRSSAQDEEQQQPQPSPTSDGPTPGNETSPARSFRSNASSARGGNGKAGRQAEGSPYRLDGGAGTGAGVGTGGIGGAAATASNKKMLKIGANVRFRGDVMECNTVILCGRLQVCVDICVSKVCDQGLYRLR